MNEHVQEALALITEQQPKKRNTVWLLGEQLKEICRTDERCAELVATDLRGGGMTLVEADKKLREYARLNGGGATGEEADAILREYFGLPAAQDETAQAESEHHAGGDKLSLEDFL